MSDEQQTVGRKPKSLRTLIADKGSVEVEVVSFEDLPEHGDIDGVDRGVLLCKFEEEFYVDTVVITDGTKPAPGAVYHASDDGEGDGFPLVAARDTANNAA